MFSYCPHCKGMVATAPNTGALPAQCPLCKRDIAGGEKFTAPQKPRPVPTERAAIPVTPTRPAQTHRPAVPTAASTHAAAASTPRAATVQINADAASARTPASERVPVKSPASAQRASSPATPIPAPEKQFGLPRFLRMSAGMHGLRTRAQHRRDLLLIGVLALLLIAQIFVAQKNDFARDAGMRPWLMRVCSVLRCEVPAWKAPNDIRLIERDVRPDRTQPGVLRVRGTLRNDARWAQPWPMLRMTLSDANGRALGSRLLTAEQYLGAAPAQTTLQPAQTAAIAFAVREPASNTVAFSFEFL